MQSEVQCIVVIGAVCFSVSYRIAVLQVSVLKRMVNGKTTYLAVIELLFEVVSID